MTIPKNNSEPDAGPLSGYRVLDFGWVLAGAIPGMVLADMGAQVIKVDEAAQGDELNFLECARLGLLAAIGATAPGKTLGEAEAAALQVADGMGYAGRYFLKGHGLGTTKFRDVPRPVEKDYVLRPGETVNYESILLDERFGCATLEDTIRITESGHEVLGRCEHRWW